MGGKADRRLGGWAVSRSWIAAGIGGVLSLSAYPPNRLSTDIHADDIHAEYVKYPSAGGAAITAYLAYPERKDRAPGVVVIHEIFGLSDWIRQTTEQLARDGFVALAPDLLSRRGGTPPSSDEARKLIAGLDPDTVTLGIETRDELDRIGIETRDELARLVAGRRRAATATRRASSSRGSIPIR